MKTFFVGIDISKDWLDVAICDELTLEILSSLRCDNTVEGIEKTLKKCLKEIKEDSCWCCFEHTGNYGLLLSSILELQNISYSAVPALEIKRSIGMTRGKDDQIDAVRIARYAATNKVKLKQSTLPSKQLLRVKYLLTHRSLTLKTCVQLKNSYKSFKIAGKLTDIEDIIKDLDNRITILKLQILEIEQKIKAEISADKLLSETFDKITSVKGVGLMIAASMIVCTNNFTAFDNPRSFNCYAGLAPFAYTSGSSIKGKTRTSNLRNKTLKTLLFNGANSAVLCDHSLKTYYNRKMKDGKNRMVVINAVACKMVYRIFAVLKRDEPYVNLVL